MAECLILSPRWDYRCGNSVHVSQPSVAVNSEKMAYSRGLDWGLEGPPALGDLRLAESVRSELVEEKRLLDGPGAFFFLAWECPWSALFRRMSRSYWT